MEEKNNKKINYIESKKKGLIVPIVFLVICIVLSLSLFAYNKFLEAQIGEIQEKTAEFEATALNLQEQVEIKVYSIIDANKFTIEELEKRSEITKYLNHFKDLSEEYSINFQGFSISKWVINTTIVVNSSTDVNEKLPYQKVTDFISSYRSDSEAILSLEFIDMIEWMDSIKFNATFKVK